MQADIKYDCLHQVKHPVEYDLQVSLNTFLSYWSSSSS